MNKKWAQNVKAVGDKRISEFDCFQENQQSKSQPGAANQMHHINRS